MNQKRTKKYLMETTGNSLGTIAIINHPKKKSMAMKTG